MMQCTLGETHVRLFQRISEPRRIFSKTLKYFRSVLKVTFQKLSYSCSIDKIQISRTSQEKNNPVTAPSSRSSFNNVTYVTTSLSPDPLPTLIWPVGGLLDQAFSGSNTPLCLIPMRLSCAHHSCSQLPFCRALSDKTSPGIDSRS